MLLILKEMQFKRSRSYFIPKIVKDCNVIQFLVSAKIWRKENVTSIESVKWCLVSEGQSDNTSRSMSIAYKPVFYSLMSAIRQGQDCLS